MSMNVDRTRVFDKRVVQRYIRAGRVTKEEYAAWLTALGDAEPNITPQLEGGDSDGYEPEPEPEPEPERQGASEELAATSHGFESPGAPTHGYPAPAAYGAPEPIAPVPEPEPEAVAPAPASVVPGRDPYGGQGDA